MKKQIAFFCLIFVSILAYGAASMQEKRPNCSSSFDFRSLRKYSQDHSCDERNVLPFGVQEQLSSAPINQKELDIELQKICYERRYDHEFWDGQEMIELLEKGARVTLVGEHKTEELMLSALAYERFQLLEALLQAGTNVRTSSLCRHARTAKQLELVCQYKEPTQEELNNTLQIYFGNSFDRPSKLKCMFEKGASLELLPPEFFYRRVKSSASNKTIEEDVRILLENLRTCEEKDKLTGALLYVHPEDNCTAAAELNKRYDRVHTEKERQTIANTMDMLHKLTGVNFKKDSQSNADGGQELVDPESPAGKFLDTPSGILRNQDFIISEDHTACPPPMWEVLHQRDSCYLTPEEQNGQSMCVGYLPSNHGEGSSRALNDAD